MNILFVYFCPIDVSVGGVQRVTNNLALEFARRGHNVAFFCTNTGVDKQDESGFWQYFSGSESVTPQEMLDKYLEILQRHGTEIVISQRIVEDEAFLMENTPKTIKRLSCIHVRPFPFVGKEWMARRSIQNQDVRQKMITLLTRFTPYFYRRHLIDIDRRNIARALESCDRLCLLSDKFFPLLFKLMPDIDKSKVVAINNPNTYPVSHDIDFDDKEKIILWVGRLGNLPKNIKGFIDVWNLLYKQNPEWRAMIVGDGKDRQMLEAYAKRKRVRNLTFEGRQRDTLKYYRKASILCVTSFYEGWGMVLTEGMSMGCVPVCYNSYESAEEIIDDGINGFLCKPFDKKTFANKVQWLIDNPEQMRQFGRNSLSSVARFDAKRVADCWENVINTIMR